MARYRYGRVLQAKKDDAAALAAFEAAIRAARDCPPPDRRGRLLEAARLHERLARKDQAIDYYRAASTLVRRRRRHARRGEPRARSAFAPRSDRSRQVRCRQPRS